jgi:hypothetical protein
VTHSTYCQVSFDSQLLIFTCYASKGIFEKYLYSGTFGLTSTLSRDLEKLLISNTLFDFTIQHQKSKISCHKCLLGCRSSYFNEILQKDISKFELDFPGEWISQCLEFLYTGTISTNFKNSDLLKVSEALGIKLEFSPFLKLKTIE